MLTLNGQRTVGGCSVYPDDVHTFNWYYLPQSPRIALDDTGKAIFSLVVYRRNLDTITEEERRTRLGGGVLTFSVDLTARDEDLAAIRAAIVSDPEFRQKVEADYLDELGIDAWDPAKVAAAIQLAQVPVIDGVVTVGVLAETAANGEFLATMVGGGKAPLVGNHRAAVSAKLTMDGAVLLQEVVKANRPAIYVRYEFQFQHRLAGVTMVVWCQADKAFSAFQEQMQSLQETGTFHDTTSGNSSSHWADHDESISGRDVLTRSIIASERAGVTITPEGPLPPEQALLLQEQGMKMLTDFLATTFLEFKPGADFEAATQPELKTELPIAHGKEYGHHGIEYYQSKTWNESMRASLNFTLESKSVLVGTLPVEDNLVDVLHGTTAEEAVLEVDLQSEFTEVIDVPILCTADFDNDPVDLVTVHVEYAQGRNGPVKKDFSFKKDSPTQRFVTWKDGGDGTYRYDATIFYKNSGATLQYHAETDNQLLVLDTDALGVLKVDVQAGIIDWERVTQVLLTLTYGDGPLRKELQTTLVKGRESVRWVEAIGERVLRAYTWQATFVDKNGQRLEQPAVSTRSPRVVVNQPFQQELRIQVVPAGNFKAAGGLLSQVLVGLRYTDPANQYSATEIATLAKQEDSFTWKVALVNPDLRSYEYQVKVVYSDGVVREDEWRRTDAVILPVGDPFGMRVEVNPSLLNIPPGRYSMGTLTLSFSDPGLPRPAEKTFSITDFTKPFYWYFRLHDPARHTYTWQLTLYRVEDDTVQERILPPQQEAKEVLILKPPAPLPVG
ncbi:MAG: hypothetical protein Q8P41_09290 [Pseudomonadota bacterium]|nr:hypothetical protein [Pseudomonadota bacterium]